MSIRPAKRRSKAPTATLWWQACARAATARSIPLDGPEQLAGIVKELAKPGDYVVCLGAGSITQWAYALPAELAALE